MLKIKSKKAILLASLVACLFVAASAILPACAYEREIGKTQISFMVEGTFNVKVVCPEHATMFVNDDGPYMPLEEVSLDVSPGESLRVLFIPEKGYKMSDIRYSVDATTTISGDSITISDIAEDGEVLASTVYVGASNPVTLDDSQIFAWLLVLIATSITLTFAIVQLFKSNAKERAKAYRKVYRKK